MMVILNTKHFPQDKLHSSQVIMTLSADEYLIDNIRQ